MTAVITLPPPTTADDAVAEAQEKGITALPSSTGPPPPSATPNGEKSSPATTTTVKNPAKAPVSDELPDEKLIDEILQLEVQDADGVKHSLKSLVRGNGDGVAGRSVVVFIRHFYCSFCQEYVRALSDSLSPSHLANINPPARLIIIGCGSPSLIQKYTKDTSSAFPIYADPSRAIYKKLNFIINLDGITTQLSPPESKQDSYMRRKSFWHYMSSTTRQFSMAGRKFFSAGKVSQNGGELVFEISDANDGVGGEQAGAVGKAKLVWWHRMKDTADHTEVSALNTLLEGKIETP